jgi:hypothetical protein
MALKGAPCASIENQKDCADRVIERRATVGAMKYLKVLCGVGFFAVLWTLLFVTLIPNQEAIGGSLAFRQPVKA